MEAPATPSDASISSHRYKVAMTARARQRRMRRMKERNAAESPVATTTTTAAVETKTKVTERPPTTPVAVTPDSAKRQSRMKSRYERSLSQSKRRMAVDTAVTTPTGATTPPMVDSVPPKTVISPVQSPPPVTNHPISSLSRLLPTLSASLSPQEVRDAANFTSIQFCSQSTGEVEICEEDVNDHSKDEEEGGVFMNAVWSERGEDRMEKGDIFEFKEAGGLVRLLTPDKMVRAGMLYFLCVL